MQLCDEGKLRLDDTIDTKWAKFKMPDGKEAKPTIRQLLTHTSGLSSMTVSSKPFWSSLQFPSQAELEEDNTENRSPAKFPPSEKLKYSNLGYTLLGEVVEAKTGLSYAHYIQQKILKPLGMADTRVDTETRVAELAKGYAPFRRQRFEPVAHFDSGVMKPACGLVSTADDMGKFIAWQLSTLSGNSNEVLSSRTLREMQRPLRLTEDWSFGQGLGFQSVRRNETTMVGHGGQMPGAFSNTQIQVEKKLGISILTNGMLVPINPGDTGSIMDGLFEATSAVDSEAARGEARHNSAWASSRNLWKIPSEFDPPPTQA